MTGRTDLYLSSLIEAAKGIRALYRAVPTKSGRPSRGPTWVGVGECERCGHMRIISTRQGKGERFTCTDFGGMGTTSGGYYGPLKCGGFLNPVWYDGPIPDMEDARQEQADYVTGRKRGYAK